MLRVKGPSRKKNKFFNVFLRFPMLLTLILTLTLSHFLTVSLFLTLTLNLSLNHSWHAEQLLFSSLCSKVTLTLSHSDALTLTHSLTLTLFHSLIHSLLTCWTTFVFISMLKTHCLLLKIAMLFWDISPLPSYFRSHRAGSQLKTLQFSAINSDFWA